MPRLGYRCWQPCARLAALALAATVAWSAHAHPEPSQGVAARRSQPLAVAAGTPIRIHLDQPIGTSVSRAGDAWEATVLDNVRASDGRIIIPAGAGIRGKVVGVDWGEDPRIELDIATVQTRFGVSPLAARFEAAVPVSYVESRSFDPDTFAHAPQRGYDVAIYPDPSRADLQDIYIPARTTFVLRVTRPLVP